MEIKPVSLMRLTTIGHPDELKNTENIVVEPKYDGWKVQIIKDGEVKIFSRKGEDKTDNFPYIVSKINIPDKTFIEGELVYWEDDKQILEKVISIAGSKPQKALEKAKELKGTFKLHLFDILWHNGKNVSTEPFSKRREILKRAVKTNDVVKITEQYPFNKWRELIKQVIEVKGEGLVFKMLDKPYRYKELRTSEPKPKIMFKYKGSGGKEDSDDYVVYDYVITDKGNLKALFGQYYEGKLYKISEIANFSKKNEDIIKEKIKKGPFVIEIGFQERVPKGLRHQKFLRFRDDKKIEDATMDDYHIKHINKLKKADNFFLISKRAKELTPSEFLKEISTIIPIPKANVRVRNIGFPSAPANLDFNVNKAFDIISTLESGGKSHAIGDTGSSFGLTQVHGPYFMRWLARNKNIQDISGLSSKDLEDLARDWKKYMGSVGKADIWKTVPVEKNVEEFMKSNPNKVVKRKEGITIRLNPRNLPGVIKKRGNRYIGQEFDMEVLEKHGFNSTQENMSKLQRIADTYITDRVARTSVARLLLEQDHPETMSRFEEQFSSSNIQKDKNTRKLVDWVSRSDFAIKARNLINMVNKYNYNPTAHGAYNMYQLMAIANASGIYRVKRFLRDRKLFGPGHTTYLTRANPMINKMTGRSTNVIDGGSPGFPPKKVEASAEDEFKEEPTQVDPLKGVSNKYLRDMLNEYVWLKENKHLVKEDVESRYNRRFTDEDIEQVIYNTLLQKYRNMDKESNISNALLKCAEYMDNTLYFPAQYAEDIKAGKRRYSIRLNDINVKPNQIAKCKSYSGGDICDVLVISKAFMSIPRIEKAHGKMVSEALQRRFGGDRQFVVVEFEPVLSSFASDMSEVLIDKDKKLTRGQIKKHYEKPEIKDKIMSRIKDKPVMLFIGVEKNKVILKRNHNGKPIVITNAGKDREDPNNYYYWVDRRVLSFHQVFENTTELGFVDLDLHGNFSKNEALKYIKELNKKLKEKYSTPKVYNSGGGGFHVEFSVPKTPIDKLRGELKDLLTDLNKEWDNITTDVVKGNGMRTDITTLHNKGSIRVPGSIGEHTGKVKMIVGSNNAETNHTEPFRDNAYMTQSDEPFHDYMINHPPKMNVDPIIGGGYVAASAKLDKEYVWLMDEDSGKFHFYLNMENGKRKREYLEHIDFAKNIGLSRLSTEGWRGRIFIYVDGTADVQWYGEKSIKEAPSSVMTGIFDLLKDNKVKSVEYEQIVGFPTAEWKANHWMGEEKKRLLDKHMEKRHWMGHDEPDPDFMRMLDQKFAVLVISNQEIPKEIFAQYNVNVSYDLNDINKCDGIFIYGKDINIPKLPNDKLIGLNYCAPAYVGDFIKGKKIACWYDVVGKVKRAGAIYSRNPIEVDENIISSIGPDQLNDAIHVFCNILVKKKFADNIEEENTEEELLEEENIEEDKKKVDLPKYEGFGQVEIKEQELPEEEEDFSSLFDSPQEEFEDTDFVEKEDDDEEEEEDIGAAPFVKPLEPIKNENGEIINDWPQKIERPVMSAEARDIFSEKNISDSAGLTRVFNDPTSWQILKKNPDLAQQWVLPAIIVNIGKKWFYNNATKSINNKDVAETPFSMFSQEDIELVKSGVDFEQLPSYRSYVSIITEQLTKIANKYFSYGYRVDPNRGSLPMGPYLTKALSRRMEKVIASQQGFREIRVPVCSFCKGRVNKRQSNETSFEMELVPGSKPKRWVCPRCSKKYNENKEKISMYGQELRYNDNEIESLHSSIARMDKLLEEEPNNNQIIQQKQAVKNKIITLTNKNDFLSKNLNELGKTQYSLKTQSLGTPYWHTWCPNVRCPGNRVPLTALDLENPFWKTEKGAVAAGILQSRFGINFLSQSAEDLPTVASHRIPPEELLDVPFICPHDYVKFTLRQARYKGLDKKGGFFWEPWQKAKWEEEFQRNANEIDEIGVEANPENVERNLIIGQTGHYLAVLARKLFNTQYEAELEKSNNWLEGRAQLMSEVSIDKALERAKKSKPYGSYQRRLAMYDSLNEISELDPNTFVAWMSELKIDKKFMAVKDNIIEANAFSKVKLKEKKDNIYLPALHSWVAKMMERKDWFSHYQMDKVLTSDRIDGIYSNGPGTFFIARVGDLNLGKEEETTFGITCSLIPKKRKIDIEPKYKHHMQGYDDYKEKQRPMRPRTSVKPKVLRFLGIWKIPDTSGLPEDIKNGTSPVPLDSKLLSYAHPDKNLIGQILFSDFYNAALSKSQSSLGMGDYVLVQALIMPGKHDPEPIRDIKNIRNNSDTGRQIFSKLGALMAGKEIEEEHRKLLKEFFNDIKEYGDDPEEMQMYIEDFISGFENIKESSLKEYKKKRNFKKTPEPEGKTEKTNKYRYVIQEHNADKAGKHFDLRLENDKGALSSWAIPKAKLPIGKEKLLAIKTEDHPIEYMDFSGIIPSGYGKGKVKIYDKGTYEEIEKTTNKLIFRIKGKGTYNLIKTDKNWLITKGE